MVVERRSIVRRSYAPLHIVVVAAISGSIVYGGYELLALIFVACLASIGALLWTGGVSGLAVAALVASNSSGVIGELAKVGRWPLLAMAIIAVVAGKRSPFRAVAVGAWSKAAIGGVGGLCALAVTSTAWSSAPLLTLQRSIALSSGVVLAVLVASEPRRRARFDRMLCVALSALGVGSLLWAFRSGVDIGEVSGPFGNQNALGVTAGIGVPFLLAYTVGSSLRQRALVYVGAASLALAGLLTGSRGAALALAVGTATLAFRSRRRLTTVLGTSVAPRSRPAVRLTMAAGGVAILAVVLLWRVDISVDNRFRQWQAFTRITQGEALLGTGFGTSQVEFREFQTELGYDSRESTGAQYHNSFIGIASDLGILGAIITAFLFALVWGVRRYADDVTIVVLAAGAASAMVESWLFAVGSGWSVWFWISMFSAVRRRDSVTVTPRDAYSSRPYVAVER